MLCWWRGSFLRVGPLVTFEFPQRLISPRSPTVNTTDKQDYLKQSARNGFKVFSHIEVFTLSQKKRSYDLNGTILNHIFELRYLPSYPILLWKKITWMTSGTFCIFWDIIRVHLTAPKKSGKVTLRVGHSCTFARAHSFSASWKQLDGLRWNLACG